MNRSFLHNARTLVAIVVAILGIAASAMAAYWHLSSRVAVLEDDRPVLKQLVDTVTAIDKRTVRIETKLDSRK